MQSATTMATLLLLNGRTARNSGKLWDGSTTLGHSALWSQKSVCYTFVKNVYASLAWRNGGEVVNYRAGVSLVHPPGQAGIEIFTQKVASGHKW